MLIHNTGFERNCNIEKISNCDLIYYITSQLSHTVTDLIKAKLRIRNNKFRNQNMENKKGTDEYLEYSQIIRKLRISPYRINGAPSGLRNELNDINVNKLCQTIKKRLLQTKNTNAYKRWLEIL
ncbi:MAG: hypothetical protein H8E60_01765 [Candidatus Marinimicrobia bacterium]|nr:hypothetical protein [Candidatus Neomarinimicrobiota bacterium]